MSFDAFWLPALPALPSSTRSSGEPGTKPDGLRSPDLDAVHLRTQIDALLAAAPALRRRSVGSIVAVIDRVARRLVDPRDPLRVLADDLLPPVTGFSPAMTRLTLDRMATDWRADRLEQMLASDLGDAGCLDGFVRLPGRPGRVHAVGPRLAFHVFSGNVPGVAVMSLIRTLLLKTPSLGKTASGEPVLAPLFAKAIAEEDDLLGSCLAVTHWKGGDKALEEVAFEKADVVIAYGSSSTIESLRAHIPPTARLIEHGSRVSFAMIAREALADIPEARETAQDAALAVATFDQQGCVSPHFIFCEEDAGVKPADWITMLAEAMEAVESDLPRGTISAAESAAIQQARGVAEIGGLAGTGQRVLASPGSTRWTILFEPTGTLRLSCLNRLVRVIPVTSIDEVPDRIAALTDLLQTVGTAGPADRFEPVARELARMGVSRVASLAEMAWPPAWWHHDGRSPLGELVRWCDWEEG